jgi:DNA-binding CsgD family transcriptional regulator
MTLSERIRILRQNGRSTQEIAAILDVDPEIVAQNGLDPDAPDGP